MRKGSQERDFEELEGDVQAADIRVPVGMMN
jgi:hypothetical protein